MTDNSAPPPPPGQEEEERGRQREPRRMVVHHTRWDDQGSKTFVPGIPTFIPGTLSKQELEALLLRIRIEEVGYKCQNNQVDLEHFRQRSPSPTPVYDNLGKRMNTRDQRAKQRLINERHYLIEKACRVNPQFKPPADYRPMCTKRTKKIYIPLKNYPDYNFIGLIIGPRGLTQKQMEKESGAKIAIRGRGSVKAGKNQGQPGDEDELHVLITADSKHQIAIAAKMVKKLLVPVEEGKNEHKRAQLRKLAEINGTLRDNLWQPAGRTWTSADVYCKHCGEISHPTADCPLKGKTVDKAVIDNEYNSFMSEVGLRGLLTPSDGSSGKEAEKSYEDFMRDFSQPSNPQPTPQAQQWSQGAGGYPPYTPQSYPGYPPQSSQPQQQGTPQNGQQAYQMPPGGYQMPPGGYPNPWAMYYPPGAAQQPYGQ